MKNKRIISRIIAIVTLLVVIASCAALLAACHKSKTKSITDIFKMRDSYGELTASKLEFTLPAGWEVYTNSTSSSSSANMSQNSDVGYIPELDAFVVSLKEGSSTKLSVVKCGDKTMYHSDLIAGMMFHPNQGIRALRYKDGLIACLFDDGTAGAFDAKTGREVLSRSKFGKDPMSPDRNGTGYLDTKDATIDSVIKILCGGLVAVHYNYDHSGKSGHISIYRPEMEGQQRGELVCRIKSSYGLAQVEGFDGRYVTVSGTSNGEYIFKIPDHASSNGAEDIDSTPRGSFTTNSKTNYTDEVTYIGNGKFFVCQDWEVSEGNDYTYYNGSKYVDLKHGVYNADNDTFTEVGKDTIFNNLTNNYYSSSKAGLDTNAYLNDGYTYVSFGITVYESNGKKLGLYDQFIIDSDLNIVMSLTGNYGVTIKDQAKDKVGFFDLIMYGVDGLYYVPIQPSEINLYDKSGNLVGHNDRSAITRQEFNSNIMVAEMPGESSSSSLFGAYDRYGNQIVPFEYDMLSSYRGPYTIGRRYGRKGVEGENTATRKLCLIGPNGQEIEKVETIDKDGNIDKESEPFSDIAYSSSSSTSILNAIYKTGCYMFRVDTGEKNGSSKIYKYGIRNFRPGYYDSEIIPATMAAGSILYSPASSPSDVFVFEKSEGTGTSVATYIVYRLV